MVHGFLASNGLGRRAAGFIAARAAARDCGEARRCSRASIAIRRAVAQPGSVPEWGSGGRGFKSPLPDQLPNPLTSTTSPFGQWPRPAPRVQSVCSSALRSSFFATLAELHFRVYIGLTSTRRTHVLQPPGRTCLSCALEGDV